MTIQQTLQKSTIQLKNKNIPLASLDAEVLLAFTLNKSKEYLYAHPEKTLTKNQIKKFQKFLKRRLKHEPIAYITRQKEFYGLNFYVNRDVLIPRPETEILVEETLRQIQNLESRIKNQELIAASAGSRCGGRIKNLTIIDVGAGSSCIAVALSKHLPKFQIYAADISTKALTVAKRNAKKHKAKIKFLKGDLLSPLLNSKFLIRNSTIIIANLPYLTTKQWQNTQPEIRKYEPRQALDCGHDGLKHYQKLFQQLFAFIRGKKIRFNSLQKNSHLFVFLEIDPSQSLKIKKLIKYYFPKAKIEIKKDLNKLDRVVKIEIR